MSRSNARGGAIAALALTLFTSACTDMYLDRRDTVSFAAGDAVAANKVTHMVDPWPSRAGDRSVMHGGERMGSAAERYRLNDGTPLATSQTAAVQCAAVVPPLH